MNLHKEIEKEKEKSDEKKNEFWSCYPISCEPFDRYDTMKRKYM